MWAGFSDIKHRVLLSPAFSSSIVLLRASLMAAQALGPRALEEDKGEEGQWQKASQHEACFMRKKSLPGASHWSAPRPRPSLAAKETR